MTSLKRPLDGCIVGMSISEDEETASLGFDGSEVNRTLIRLAGTLLGQGVRIVFGHDWRDDGVMEAVHSYVERFQAPVSTESQPIMVNFLAWPDTPRLRSDQLSRLKGTLRVEQAGLPEHLVSYLGSSDPNVRKYLRARALTHMRRTLTSRTNARLCLGGRLRQYQGRYPGVIEEALLAVEADEPLYLAKLLGGASRQIIRVLLGEGSPNELCPLCSNPLYENPPIIEPLLQLNDLTASPDAVYSAFRQTGLSGISSRNGLSEEENRQLFEAQTVDEIIQAVLRGLSRIKKSL